MRLAGAVVNVRHVEIVVEVRCRSSIYVSNGRDYIGTQKDQCMRCGRVVRLRRDVYPRWPHLDESSGGQHDRAATSAKRKGT